MHALKKNRPLRRIVLASAATVSGMVLLLSLKPHTSPGLAVGSSAPAPQSSASAPAQPGGASGDSSGGSSGGSKTGVSKTVTGDTVQTRWGPVQVRVTIKSGKLTDVTAVAYPQGNPRDQQINNYALPQLRREALAAQSAQIDTVSGATYTSGGYRQSLQSALDSAGL
ncbi:FMN-binding protein [Streptomyces pluripotens]|uniref:FMN-binding protein n=1 Tax=Streptomyces pluripotens TaxID=1355015 RepID=A0A221NUC8_9ACTN|nr:MULTISPECIES: FMN-binding protein [Streptomyces]ARP69354.1 FMN-binding protein [Streptomyces pluripotens]ASN23613.1 FMN-binding protein [Streptomyces pluripotens]KIE28355.1 FMN-binding protein [Streptomyces sp. MUSC 125]MCH0555298.1 FMN-binding protein [Streptomyces sp. MUM 16J]